MKKAIMGITICFILLAALIGCTQQENNTDTNKTGTDDQNKVPVEISEDDAVINETISNTIDETQEPNLGEML